MKKVSGRLANLTPEQREKLLKKLREQKVAQENSEAASDVSAKNQIVEQGEFLGLSAGEKVLSFSQQRLWFLDKLEGQSAVYNIPARLHIEGHLNVEALSEALTYLFSRHDALRSVFPEIDGSAQVNLLAQDQFALQITDLSHLDVKEQQHRLTLYCEEIAQKQFDLASDVLFKAHVLMLSEQKFELLICIHHIIADAWSMRILVRELSLAYKQLSLGEVVDLGSKPGSYLDYAVWQRQCIGSEKYQQQAQFWKQKLAELKPLVFPFDKTRPLTQGYEGKQLVQNVSQPLSHRLRQLARQENTTLFTVLLSAWHLILSRYSHQKDFCIGTPVANRPYSSIENSIGFFLNTVAIRIHANEKHTFSEFLDVVKKSALESFAHSDLPFEKVIQDLGLQRDPSQSPIFQSMFSFQNDALEQQIHFEELKVELSPIHTGTAKFDLSMDVIDQGEFIQLALEFNSTLLSDVFAQALQESFIHLLEQLVQHPDARIGELKVLTEQQQKRLRVEWNGKVKVFDGTSDWAKQFEACAEKNPDNIALRVNETCLSYQALNSQANQLAHALNHAGYANLPKMGVLLEQPQDYLVTIIALLKLGITYIPLVSEQALLEGEWKAKRFHVLVNEQVCAKPAFHTHASIQCIAFESLADASCDNLALDIDSEKLAFQSRTQNNKALVGASHRSISNTADWYQSVLPELKNHQALEWCYFGSWQALAEQSFLLSALLSGESLHLFCESDLLSLIENNHFKHINNAVLKCSSLQLHRLFELMPELEHQLGAVFLNDAREKFGSLQASWLNAQFALWNCYCLEPSGEIVSAYKVNKTDGADKIGFNIGRAIQNHTVDLLDDALLPVPVGAWGRMCVEGVQSHDFARFDAQGNLILFPLVHLDTQASHTTIFADYLETHAQVLSLDGVQQALLFESSEGLSALLVLKPAAQTDENSLLAALKQKLPLSLLPHRLVLVKQLPVSAQGALLHHELFEFLRVRQTQETFWQNYLAEEHELALPYDFSNQVFAQKNPQAQSFYIEQGSLKAFTALELESFLRAAWLSVLARYTGQSEFFYSHQVHSKRFGWVNAGRDIFVPVKVNFVADESFAQFAEVQTQVLVQLGSQVGVSLPAKTCLLSFGETEAELLEGADLHLSILLDKQKEKPASGQAVLRARLYYNAARFEEESISQIIKHYLRTIEFFSEHPAQAWDLLNLLDAAEQQAILASCTGEKAHYAAFNTVDEFLKVFEQDSSVALVYFEEGKQCELSYQSLHQQANQLAVYLQAHHLEATRPVALCFERSVEMVIAILAVLKTGSPYLPLDPALPQERLAFMLSDSQAQFVLCHDATRQVCETFSTRINLQDANVVKACSVIDTLAHNHACEQDLFNIIYTSGSTGQPKGVMVSHEGILNRIQWMQETYRLTRESRVLQKTTYSFDVSVWEFIWPLSQGAVLVLASADGHKDPLYLRQLMAEQGISHCHFVPSMLSSWLELIDDNNSLNAHVAKNLQQVFCSGEALTRKAVNHFYMLFGQSELHNLYGPTEASIDVSYWPCEKNMPDATSVPIGKPVSNTSLYVLDKQFRVLPYGVAGELFIAGKQLARGYLNRPQLNESTFIEVELAQLGKQRLYRTGDLVRLNRKGYIDYLGRADHQVKVRGFRIELGDIESHVQAMAEVSLAVVLARELGNSKQLVAYVSLMDNAFQESQKDEHHRFQIKLKQFLSARLPEYMVPAVTVVLQSMPMLGNGKINRKALPEPQLASQIQTFKAADSEVETHLQAIWQKVLGVEKIGTRDNFFDLGGDSILSIQIISAARRQGIVIKPSHIFRYPTIAELARVASVSQKTVQVSQGSVLGEFSVSPVQNWFFSEIALADSNAAANHHFNQSVLLDLKCELDLASLKKIAAVLLEKHDVLSSQFKQSAGFWKQHYSPFVCTEENLVQHVSQHHIKRNAQEHDAQSLQQTLMALHKTLNVEQGRLIHFSLLQELEAGIEKQMLFIVAHHLVIDGVSWRILLEDMNTLFEHLNQETLAQTLPDKTLSFESWNQGLLKLAQSDYFKAEKDYWKHSLKALRYYQSPLVLQGKDRQSVFANQKRIAFSLNNQLSEQFLKQAQRNFNADANDLLLCALAETLSNNHLLALNLEMHGRELPEAWSAFLEAPDVSRTIGWFTSIFPVLLQSHEAHQAWPEKLKSIKEQLRKIPAKGLGFGLLSRTGTQAYFKEASLRAAKLDISFNYLGQLDQALNSPFFAISQARNRLSHLNHLDQADALTRPHLLDIVVYINAGNLHCEFLYDAVLMQEAQVQAYAQHYQQALESLIESCCAQLHPLLSPSDLHASKLSQQEIEHIEHSVYASNAVLPFASIASIHDLLPTQQGMLFHNLFSASDETHQYIEQFCVELKGQIHAEHFQSAWQLLIGKYANLRSIFYWQTQKPVQVVLSHVDFSVEHVDFTQADNQASKETVIQTLERFLEKDRQRGFELSQSPLMRVYLVRVAEHHYWLMWSYHHILLDGWSVPLVLNDVFEFYTALCEERDVSKLTLDSLYRFEDYIAWYQKQDAHSGTQQEQFWKTQFEGFSVANAIDIEASSQPIPKEEHGDGVVKLELSETLSDSLRYFARKHQLTLNTVMQAAWTLLLAHYSGDEDVVFGTTVSGRPESFEGVEQIVGMFINTLPLRVKLNERSNLMHLLHTLQENQQAISEHQGSSLMRIQKWVGMEDDSRLFDSMLVFENFPVDEKLKQQNTFFSIGEFHSFEQTNYPLTIIVEPNKSIRLRVLFDGSVYRKSTMMRLLGHLEAVLGHFPQHGNTAPLDIPYMKPEELRALENWNKTETRYPREATLIELFAEKAAQFPKHLALKFDAQVLSYQALDERSNQLARYLNQQGIAKGQRVALFLDRSEAMLVSVLAVVKTGAAYVPLDPDYPKERLQYMLGDCEPAHIISLSKHQAQLDAAKASHIQCPLVFYDKLLETLEQFDCGSVDFYKNVQATDLAYVMYTSGSTGQPKGVCLSHRSMIRLLINNWYLNLGPNDKVGHVVNVCFDASAYEIWGALLHGACLIGFDKETVLNGERFEEKLQREGVSNMLLTTSLFHIYSKQRPGMFKKMRSLLIGGEPLNADATRRVLENEPPLQILNVYGPTENGVLTTVFDTWNLLSDANNVPVGKPISNTTVYILDKRNKEVPVGVIGELVSGGDGVGIGYWRKPELTSQSYIEDPVSQVAGARAYRTGDLARRLPDGSFEVLGRRDKQIKIRGFRIEPGEIIKYMLEEQRVQDAVIHVHEADTGQKLLLGYYVLKQGEQMESKTLLASLKEKLPQYMVPQFLIEIPKLPITPNGKLDTTQLPAPRLAQQESYQAPRNALEQKLLDVWREVLGLEQLGIRDNFFEVGGDSIISIQIVSRAKRSGIDLSPKLLFEYPSIIELAQQLDYQDEKPQAEQGLVQGEVLLSPIQQWFFEQRFAVPDHFNQSLLFKVKGFLSIQSITPVLSALLRQHDALRLRFEFQKQHWRQAHDNSARSLSLLADVLTEHNLSHSAQPYQDMLEHARTLQGSLSIQHGPLIKMVLYHLGEQGQRLLVIVHHLVVDGVSWRILVEDLNLALEQHFDNQAIHLGTKSTSFQFYAQKLKEVVEAKTFSDSLNYWLAFETSIAGRTVLSRTADEHAHTHIVQKRFDLDTVLSQSLLRDSNRAYKTDAQELLLLIYALAVKQSGISETLCIELESHGRDALPDTLFDLSNTIGWFTAMYPLLFDFDQQAIADGNFDQAIKLLKNTLCLVPLKGLSYFLAKYVYQTEKGERLLKQIPKIELAFNYLGQVQAGADTGILTLDSDYLEQNLSVIEDSSPLNQASHLLSVSVLMSAQSFHVSVNYDEAHISASKVDSFIEAFKHYSVAINEFCLDETHFGFTPSDLPYCDLNQAQIDALCAAQKQHSKTGCDAVYPLSPMQEGMLFHSRMDSSSGMYCEQVSVLFSGQLNVSAMEAAWNGAINHHTLLRSSFVWENLPRPLQLVQSEARVTLELLDWRNENNTQEKLNHFLAADRAKGFDFSKAPLMRLYYIVLPSEHSGQILGRFIWSYHHILLDGWSMPLLMREVFERYNAKAQGLPLTLVEHEGSYQDYIYWLYQKSAQVDAPYKKQRDQFWLNYLAGIEEPTHMGLARSAPSQQTDSALRYREQGCALSVEQSECLNQFAVRHHITLNTLFQAAWALLLARYSGEQNVVFGITVSGRPHELKGVEAIVGLFINTIPFRARVDEKTALSDWLQDIFKNQNQLREYETTPLVDIQAQSRIDSSRALFDSILVFENYPMDEAFDYSPAGLHIEDLKVYEQTNFPLSLIILPGKQLDMRMLFDSELFEQQAIETVLGHLKTLLLDIGNLEADAQRSLQNIDYLNAQEQFRIIKQWNNTESVYPRDAYLQDIVSEQASRYPDVEALCSEGKSLTFKQLEARANQLAHFICADERGDFVVKQGDKVVICMNRSEELVISILAVLKAGAVYVPLDPGYPEERQRYMLEDTRCHLVLTDQHHAELVKQLCSTKSLKDHLGFVNLHQAAQSISQQPEIFEPHLPPYVENEEVPAAILYTSGSTGQPKGVCLTHRGLSRMVMNTNYMQVTREDRVAHVSNICFDAASFEIWAALLNAVPLVIFKKDIVLDLALFEQKLKQEKVSILLIATALFNLVAKEKVSAFSELRYLFFGGEASNAGMVRKVLHEAPPQHLMHMYGPSENATYATWYEVKQVAEDAKSIPIGRAVSNSQVYIMNQQGSLLPPGVAGEIVCAGDGLALGYLNKPEQTQKSFVMRSLPNQAAQRMYLTGDLGIWLPDGTIEILGRIDNQVKIRGHRIEPEEVIARINALERIKKSYVLVKQDSEDKKYLLAYFVPEASWLKEQSDAQQRARELKLTLKSLMPDYMVPSFYVEIDELPLTPNGKIDTKALPEADFMQAASVYQAPQNELEHKLVAIWAEVLGQTRIGVNDDFFELGGHSLLATQIHSRIRQQLGIDIPLRTLFELPTIREFSEFWLAFSKSEAELDEDSGEEFEEGEL